MKQTINLLPIQPKIAYQWLCLKNLLVTLGLSGIICLALSFYWGWQAQQLESLLVVKQQQNLTLQQEIVQLNIKVAARDVPIALSLELVGQQRYIHAMQQMIDLTSLEDRVSSPGFLSTMLSLENSLPDNASLSSVKISSGLRLEHLRGQTSTAQDLPAFLKNLRSAGLLQSQTFAKVRSLYSGDSRSFEILSAEQEDNQ